MFKQFLFSSSLATAGGIPETVEVGFKKCTLGSFLGEHSGGPCPTLRRLQKYTLWPLKQITFFHFWQISDCKEIYKNCFFKTVFRNLSYKIPGSHFFLFLYMYRYTGTVCHGEYKQIIIENFNYCNRCKKAPAKLGKKVFLV